MKQFLTLCGLWGLMAVAGCAPLIIAGGATGGYKAATDERSLGRIWDDAAITSKVKAALVKDPVVKARKIDIDTLQGNVMFTGLVDTTAESERAVEIARRVPGVRTVKNNLQIGSKTFGQTLDDKVLGSKIKASLIGEPSIRSLNIDVDVNRGVVSLTGLVKNEDQRNRVLKIARSTSGIVKVFDNLKVK